MKRKARAGGDEGSTLVALRVPAALLKRLDDLAQTGVTPSTRTSVMLAALEVGSKALARRLKG